jgi:MHS family proline/betaine transporter-like MFS transporter
MPHEPISRVPAAQGIHPLRSAHTWKLIALIYGTVVAPTAGIYLIFNYLPVYMQTQLGLPMAVANCSNIAAVVTASVVVLWAGKLCDRYGRFRVVRWGALGHLMCAGPAFYFMSQGGGALTALLAQQIMAACTAVTYAPIGALCVELFSREIRQTAAGISYNAAVMSIGGLTPMMVTYLIRSTGSLQAPALWLSGAALVTIVVTAFAGTSEDVKLLEKRKRTDGSRIISAHESPTPGYTSPS